MSSSQAITSSSSAGGGAAAASSSSAAAAAISATSSTTASTNVTSALSTSETTDTTTAAATSSAPQREAAAQTTTTTLLELTRDPDDGSLLTAPLRTVISATCDALYDDVQSMTYGEVPIVGKGPIVGGTAAGSANEEAAQSEQSGPESGAQYRGSSGQYGGGGGGAPGTAAQKERMANLSFARRRHELGVRVARHGRAVTHLAALVKAYGESDPLGLNDGGGGELVNAPPSSNEKERNSSTMGEIVKTATTSLRHVHEAWREADEAQDAMYFHHGELWRGRKHCHDVRGAVDLVAGGGMTWRDFPEDVNLVVDRYEVSDERLRGREETVKSLQSAVRRKLVLGEVGVEQKRRRRRVLCQRSPAVVGLPWRVVLEKNGGAVRLTHGPSRRECFRRYGGGGGGSASTPDAVASTSSNTHHDDAGGTGTSSSKDDVYPIEARVTVLNEEDDAEWTLLSIDVHIEPKTGESTHQLEPNNRQKFDLHRLCAQSMAKEEARVRGIKMAGNTAASATDEAGASAVDGAVKMANGRKDDAAEQPGSNGSSAAFPNGTGNDLSAQPMDVEDGNSDVIGDREKWHDIASAPKPLDCLFEVAHTFAISLQLEMLSAQAAALKRGAWGAIDGGIDVSPIHYFDVLSHNSDESEETFKERMMRKKMSEGGNDHTGDDALPTLAVMGIHFWSCDDRFGAPVISGLYEDGRPTHEPASTMIKKRSNPLPESDRRGEQRLSLCIRAVPRKGLLVSLSGGAGVMTSVNSSVGQFCSGKEHLRTNVEKLLSSISNPFSLSASGSLLAATALCAQCRCIAVVEALTKLRSSQLSAGLCSLLPGWLQLNVEHGSISIACKISYEAKCISNQESVEPDHQPAVELFRVACDSRTGRFVTVFPSNASLLRALACNDPSGSDLQLLRVQASSTNKRRNPTLGKELTGRLVKDAFDGLARSMSILGRKAGVGGGWHDNDAMSASLRDKAVEQACVDVRTSLMACCGMAAIYGVAALALGVASGVDAVADTAGELIEHVKDTVQAAPVGIVLNQQMVEKTSDVVNGETKIVSILNRDMFAVSGSVNSEQLCIHCFSVSTEVEKPSDVPKRIECNPIPLEMETSPIEDGVGDDFNDGLFHNAPRDLTSDPGLSTPNRKQRNMRDEVQRIAPRFLNTLQQLS